MSCKTCKFSWRIYSFNLIGHNYYNAHDKNINFSILLTPTESPLWFSMESGHFHNFPVSRQPTLPAVPILQSYHMSNYIKISTGDVYTK